MACFCGLFVFLDVWHSRQFTRIISALTDINLRLHLFTYIGRFFSRPLCNRTVLMQITNIKPFTTQPFVFQIFIVDLVNTKLPLKTQEVSLSGIITLIFFSFVLFLSFISKVLISVCYVNFLPPCFWGLIFHVNLSVTRCNLYPMILLYLCVVLELLVDKSFNSIIWRVTGFNVNGLCFFDIFKLYNFSRIFEII